jgi:glycosyltransferase involved in cell wall biosynthesis
MKILQIIFTLSSGGAERFVVDLSNELADKGHEITLCVLRDDTINNYGFYKEEISNKVNYQNLAIPERFSLLYIVKLYKLINQVKPDIVHCHLNLVNYVFPLSILFKKVKFFHTIHSDATTEVKWKLEYFVRKYFYKNRSFKAITISKETSRSFEIYYKSFDYIEIYNGRKLPAISNEIEDISHYFSELRQQYNTIFLHVARCAPVKNQKMLINVFNRLIDDGKAIFLLIIGDGFNSSQNEKLKSIASDKIIFLGEKHNVTDYYMNSDAFCLTSIHEGMPISLIEAIACGCTPICTPVGGIVDTIEDGVTGYLSKSISEDDYYHAINRFLDNKFKIKKEILFDQYNNYFSIKKCAEKHIDIYKK